MIDNIFTVRIDKVTDIDTTDKIKDAIIKVLQENDYRIIDKVFIIYDFKELK